MKISHRWWEKGGRRSQQGKIEKYDIFSIKYATRKFLAVAVQNNSKEMYKKKNCAARAKLSCKIKNDNLYGLAGYPT